MCWLATKQIQWNAHAENIIMNNVARLHVYIAHMFSQFKENMEINQGINGPIQMKNIPKKLKKDWTADPHQKILFKEQH